MSFNKEVELKQKYNELLDIVYDVTSNDKVLIYKNSYSDEDLNNMITKFTEKVEKDGKLFKYLLNRNNKLFRSNAGIEIIPDVNLKNIIDSNMWECVQLLYAINRTGEPKYKNNIEKLISNIEKFNLGGDNINNDDDKEDNKDVKSKADELIMEISSTLRNTMSSSSKKDNKINPIENMIKTSQIISDKYGDDIKNGNISIQDMFNSLGRLMGDIDKETNEDENFKGIDINDMPKPEEMMKDLSDKFGLNMDMNNFNPMDMLSGLMGKEEKKKDLTDEQIKEMEEFYNKLSTEDIDRLNNLNQDLD